MVTRLGAANLSAHVHCWVRTHEMDAGLVACLDAYVDSCGGRLGEYQRHRLGQWREAQQQQQPASYNRTGAKGATQILNPSSNSGQPCSTYFTAAANAAVLSRDADLIDRFGLGSCCSD